MRTKKFSDIEILELAFEVISKEGFESFTLQDVARVTKLSPAALIKRFKNKKNLALLARNTRWDSNLSTTSSKEKYNEKGLEGIFKLVDLIARSVDSNRLGEHARWLATESLTPKSKKKVSEYFNITRSNFEYHIREAQKESVIIDFISPSDISMNLEAFIQGTIFQFIFLQQNVHITKHLKTRVDFFLERYKI